jgi:hypothetical protein
MNAAQLLCSIRSILVFALRAVLAHVREWGVRGASPRTFRAARGILSFVLTLKA